MKIMAVAGDQGRQREGRGREEERRWEEER